MCPKGHLRQRPFTPVDARFIFLPNPFTPPDDLAIAPLCSGVAQR